MEALNLDKAQLQSTQKVKNILIRSFVRKEWQQRPEASHILRYSPKYYRSLYIEITPYNPLLSKIKKIKKLKKLEGYTARSSKGIFPQTVWFNLLANSRKEIEEAPQISPSIKIKKAFWRKVKLQKIKLLPNVTRFSSEWRNSDEWNDSNPIVSIEKPFVSYIWNLRRLKDLKVTVEEDNFKQKKWILKKLDGMGILLERLETLFLNIGFLDIDPIEVFGYQNLFSHLTGLKLVGMLFEPISAKIPHICKNLKSLSLEFSEVSKRKPEFIKLLTSLQLLPQLRNLKLLWPKDTYDVWIYFKPPPGLRSLVLDFKTDNFPNSGFSGKKNMVTHWDNIQELDYLELNISGNNGYQKDVWKQFATIVLKKVRKVHSLKIYMPSAFAKIEPFIVGEVPHLYESLKKFEYIQDYSSEDKIARFDLKIMKPFRNLKELKFEGGNIICDNVEEMVSLLEENLKEGEKLPLLQISLMRMSDESWLGKTLKKISSRKKVEMRISLVLKTEDLAGLLERLCQGIQAARAGEGLVITLVIFKENDNSPFPAEKLRYIFEAYNKIQNLSLAFFNRDEILNFRRLDGKEIQSH